MGIWKVIGDRVSKGKDLLVKNNWGLHLGVAYIVYDVLSVINSYFAMIIVVLGIFIMEFYDKFFLKTRFGWDDIIVGLLGVILSILINDVVIFI